MTRPLEIVGEEPESFEGDTIYVTRTPINGGTYVQAYSRVPFKARVRLPVRIPFNAIEGNCLNNVRASVSGPVYENPQAFIDSIVELNACEVRECSVA